MLYGHRMLFQNKFNKNLFSVLVLMAVVPRVAVCFTSSQSASSLSSRAFFWHRVFVGHSEIPFYGL